MDTYEAIYYRKSVRKYSKEKLSDDKLDEVREIIDNSDSLYNQLDMTTHLIEEGNKVQEVISGIVGSYGKVEAPHYLVITSEEKEGFLENIGYCLEQVILKLTTMGIATCWIGGNINKDSLAHILDMKDSHRPVIVISFGYAKDKDNYKRSEKGKAKRKDISELIIDGNPGSKWSDLLTAAQLAPSAVNMQPWRFDIDADKLHVYAIKRNRFLKKIFKPLKHLKLMNNIDVGIALSHIKIAADHLGRGIEFERIGSAKKKKYRYIISVLMD